MLAAAGGGAAAVAFGDQEALGGAGVPVQGVQGTGRPRRSRTATEVSASQVAARSVASLTGPWVSALAVPDWSRPVCRGWRAGRRWPCGRRQGRSGWRGGGAGGDQRDESVVAALHGGAGVDVLTEGSGREAVDGGADDDGGGFVEVDGHARSPWWRVKVRARRLVGRVPGRVAAVDAFGVQAGEEFLAQVGRGAERLGAADGAKCPSMRSARRRVVHTVWPVSICTSMSTVPRRSGVGIDCNARTAPWRCVQGGVPAPAAHRCERGSHGPRRARRIFPSQRASGSVWRSGGDVLARQGAERFTGGWRAGR